MATADSTACLKRAEDASTPVGEYAKSQVSPVCRDQQLGTGSPWFLFLCVVGCATVRERGRQTNPERSELCC